MAKEYPPHTNDPSYNEFWDDLKRPQKKPPSRPSSAPRDSREQIDQDTPQTRNRKKYSLLPNINKNTNLKKFEIDFALIQEDPLFGDYRKKNIKRRLMPLEGENAFDRRTAGVIRKMVFRVDLCVHAQGGMLFDTRIQPEEDCKI